MSPVFGRSAKQQPPVQDSAPVAGKGRPTPTRKEAEAARKKSLSVPKDPKAARIAARERQRAARVEARQALVSGDQSKLPARDAGPVRAFVRDLVDTRFSAAELFIPIALFVFIATFLLPLKAKQAASYVFEAALIVFVLDGIWLTFGVRRSVRQAFPEASTRGLASYAIMRAMQVRPLRLPKPRVRIGGKPVKPKAPKQKA